MFRSFPIGRILGIPISVHGTTLIFLPLIAYLVSSGHGWQVFVSTLVALVIVFACVLLHELGHSVAALYYGIPVRQIVLYPMGGIAGLARMPRAPGKELVITIAGPAVNFALVGLAALFLPSGQVATDSGGMIPLEMGWVGAVADFIFKANLVLGGFNLISGFPMDGGRILRACLAYFLDYRHATRIAAHIGRVVALLFIVAGFYYPNPGLILVGAFVFMAAGAELRMLELPAELWDLAYGGGPDEAQIPAEPHTKGETFIWKERGAQQAEGTKFRGTIIEMLPDGTIRKRSWGE